MSDPDAATIVVTGMGAVTPYGWGVEAFARGLASGETAIRPLTAIPAEGQRTSIAGEVPGDGLGHGDEWLGDLPPRQRRRLTRIESFGLSAALEALASSRLDARDSATGVFLGTNTGGMFEAERLGLEILSGRSRAWPGPFATNQYNVTGDTIARTLGLRGPVVAMTAACSASNMAIEAAMTSLRAGETDVALAGGADALCLLTFTGFNAMRVVDTQPSRPFRLGRQGISLGEGSGFVVLETRAHAEARGAPILAQLCGAGSACDAYHMTAPDPSGAGLQQAVDRALEAASLTADDVTLVNVHGTGTEHNDSAEWAGLVRVFGERAEGLPILALKGSIGHLLGACGAVELVATLIAMGDGELPPTPGGGPIDPGCPAALCLDGPRPLEPGMVALSISLGFGGANAALLLRHLPAGSAVPSA